MHGAAEKGSAQREIIMIGSDALILEDHLLRMIERVMDYAWLYERLAGRDMLPIE